MAEVGRKVLSWPLLVHVSNVTAFAEVRSTSGIQFLPFQDQCKSRCLFKNDAKCMQVLADPFITGIVPLPNVFATVPPDIDLSSSRDLWSNQCTALSTYIRSCSKWCSNTHRNGTCWFCMPFWKSATISPTGLLLCFQPLDYGYHLRTQLPFQPCHNRS